MKKLSRIEAMVFNRMLTQFLEWTGTAVVVFGALANSLGYHPEGPYLMIAGGAIWVLVGTRWKKMSIVVTNSVLTVVTTLGLIYYYFA